MATSMSLILILGLILIPGMAAVYVWRDAKERGMQAALWTLIVLLAPMLIGLIVYLIVRSSYSAFRCPTCAGRVSEQYVICPTCGTKLRPSCPRCGMAIEMGWKVCPYCTQTLPEENMEIQEPVQKKDRVLGKLLLAVILIPIFLIVLGMIGWNGMGRTEQVGCAWMPVEDYLAECDQEKIATWIETCSEQTEEQAYILQNQVQHNEKYVTNYLVYLPFARECDSNTSTQRRFFQHILTLDVTETEDETEQGMIWEIEVCNEIGFCTIDVVYGGETLDCEIQTIAENPLALTRQRLEN